MAQINDTATWNNAISRAIDNDFENHTHYLGDGHFRVHSAHRPDYYDTTLTVVDNEPTTACSCPAGQHGKTCWHQASVLLISGHIDAPQPAIDLDFVLTGGYREALAAGRLG